jgi:transposase InsO family protein
MLVFSAESDWRNGVVMSRKRYTLEQTIHELREAKVLVERWRREYNTLRPHSSLGYWPPALEAIEPLPQSSGTTSLHSAVDIKRLT